MGVGRSREKIMLLAKFEAFMCLFCVIILNLSLHTNINTIAVSVNSKRSGIEYLNFSKIHLLVWLFERGYYHKPG